MALVMLVSWGMRAHILGTRPQLALMLYMLFLLVAVMGAVVAVLASCHAAIVLAFGSGFRAGRSTPRAGERPDLSTVK